MLNKIEFKSDSFVGGPSHGGFDGQRYRYFGYNREDVYFHTTTSQCQNKYPEKVSKAEMEAILGSNAVDSIDYAPLGRMV